MTFKFHHKRGDIMPLRSWTPNTALRTNEKRDSLATQSATDKESFEDDLGILRCGNTIKRHLFERGIKPGRTYRSLQLARALGSHPPKISPRLDGRKPHKKTSRTRFRNRWSSSKDRGHNNRQRSRELCLSTYI